MRPQFALLFFCLFAGAGCMKSLDMKKTVELNAQEVTTPFILEPMAAERVVSVSVTCDSAVNAYLVVGPAEEVAARVANGQEPKPGTTLGTIGGKGGTTSFDLKPNQQFSLLLRNPGNKKISAEVKLSSKGK